MTKGRAAPPLPKQQEHEERIAALLSLDPALMRAWALRWLPAESDTIALADDESLLETMHRVLLREDLLPRDARLQSVRWLAARGDAIAIDVLKRLEASNE